MRVLTTSLIIFIHLFIFASMQHTLRVPLTRGVKQDRLTSPWPEYRWHEPRLNQWDDLPESNNMEDRR